MDTSVPFLAALCVLSIGTFTRESRAQSASVEASIGGDTGSSAAADVDAGDNNFVLDTIDGLTGRGRPTQYEVDHPVALGTRAAVWAGDYTAPGLGGHIKIRPIDEVGVELFSDNFIRPQDEGLRRDHVIGFGVYFPTLIGDEKRFIAPSIGACSDFRFVDPLDGDGPSVSDVLFGAHAGLMGEVWVYKGLTLEFNADVYEYVGHDTGLGGWSATVSNNLTLSTVGQLTVGTNYYF